MHGDYIRFCTVVALSVTIAVFAMFLTTPKWKETHVHGIDSDTRISREVLTRGTHVHHTHEPPEDTLTRMGRNGIGVLPKLSFDGN